MADPPTEIAAEVVDVDLPDEMRDSFMPYALSVTVSRAIPDARDGLKPVQRRILHVMAALHLGPKDGHRKSAGIVGEVMGKYHPHGDGAIYEAMVRMGQPAVSMMPLVDPRGNFGGLDDPPAAYRYTEARLSNAAMAMLDGLNENAVDFVPTYDGEREEPAVLPAGLPNLLVNGVSGIAVGMATSIPPHNLHEVVEAVCLWLKAPEGSPPTLRALLKAMSGPDFPCGGVFVASSEEIEDAYRTGRGSFRLRALCTVEQVTAKRARLTFTELPHQIGAERVVKKIRQRIEAEALPGVRDAANMSDKTGARVSVELHPGADAETAKALLYSSTPLEESVSLNAVAILGGQPLLMSLPNLVMAYGNHVIETTQRRAAFVRDRAARRVHILNGLIAATVAIDQVIRVIRKAQSADAARSGLRKLLKIDDEQAEAILDMRLRRISALEESTLRSELAEQEAVIADREEMLGDPVKLRSEAINILRAHAEPLAAPRRTVIVADAEADIPRTSLQPATVTLSNTGSVSVTSKKSRKSDTGTQITAESGVALAVAWNGQIEKITLDEKPKGRRFVGILSGAAPAVLVTSSGRACRVAADALNTGLRLPLRAGETVAGAFDATDDSHVLFVSSEGRCLRTSASNFDTGAKPRFVESFKVGDEHQIVAVRSGIEADTLVTLQDDRSVKATVVKDIPAKGRRGGGVLTLPSGSTLRVVSAVVSRSPTVITDGSNSPERIPVSGRSRKPTGCYQSISAL